MNHALSVRLDDSQINLLEFFAKKEHISKTGVIRKALSKYFNENQHKIKSQVAILRKIDHDNDYVSEDL